MLRADFTYNGRKLSDFYLSMYDPDDQPAAPSRTIERSDITAARQVPNHYGAFFADTKKHYFRLIRNPSYFSSERELRLTDEDLHEIESWLMEPEYPTELTTTIDDEELSVTYFGLFTDIKYFIVGEECFGLDVTFECDSAFGYSPVISKRFHVRSARMTGVFSNDLLPRSKFVPPSIVITRPGTGFSGEAFALTNMSDGEKSMYIVLPSGVESLQIDCQHKIVTAQTLTGDTRTLRLSDIGVTLGAYTVNELVQTLSFYWLKILPRDNQLVFETSPFENAFDVEIRTRYLIHAGGF